MLMAKHDITCNIIKDYFLGGIPPPIYFGALIDRACLKWGKKRCGGQGACRLYNAETFR